MNLIISFSGRVNGNCDDILEYLATKDDTTIYFRNLNVHECSNCSYECFSGYCKYRDDDIYGLYDSMLKYDRVFLIVPMYCGNPASLYFKFNERCQDYFTHNEECYEAIISKLFIIGVYGDKKKAPDFVPCLGKWFEGSPYGNRVLGIERHQYGQEIGDKIVNVEEIRHRLSDFVAQ